MREHREIIKCFRHGRDLQEIIRGPRFDSGLDVSFPFVKENLL